MDLMTLGYPSEILPYPAIEYIPLTISTIKIDDNWANDYGVRLYIIDNRVDKDNLFRKYNLWVDREIDFSSNLLILVSNFKVKDIFYRAHRIQTIGNRRDNSYHLFSITKRYFYKDRLIFNLYTPDGDHLRRSSYQL